MPASRGMKTKMKSNELNSIQASSELVPAVSEKNDQSLAGHSISQSFCPKYIDSRRGGRGLDYPAGRKTGRELQLFAASLSERGTGIVASYRCRVPRRDVCHI
jgi:hypothetical protein